MKLKKIESQLRNNFFGTYECEFCGSHKFGAGRDDEFFTGKVIPEMKCSKCGKSTNYL